MQNNNRKPDPPEYWLVSYEEEIVIEQPAQDGIVGSSRRIIKRQTGNEVINVHPVIHGIMSLQRGRRNYTMVFAMPIPKKHYDLVMAPSEAERKAHEIADKVDEENREKAKVLNFNGHENSGQHTVHAGAKDNAADAASANQDNQRGEQSRPLDKKAEA